MRLATCTSIFKVKEAWVGSGGGGGGGTLIFHTYVGSGYFLGFKILNFNIFWGFQKNEFFFGMKILWIFFSGHHKIGLV